MNKLYLDRDEKVLNFKAWKAKLDAKKKVITMKTTDNKYPGEDINFNYKFDVEPNPNHIMIDVIHGDGNMTKDQFKLVDANVKEDAANWLKSIMSKYQMNTIIDDPEIYQEYIPRVAALVWELASEEHANQNSGD